MTLLKRFVAAARSAAQAVAALALTAALASGASAQLRIDITEGVAEPLPIAVPDFIGQDAQEQRVGADISGVITNNLERSRLFVAKNPASFLETIEDARVLPRFQDWRVIGAEALVVGEVEIDDTGSRMRVDFRLYDVNTQQQFTGLRFNTVPDDWRRVAHKASDQIYQILTGESGYFDSRVVFVAESGPKTDRVKRLAIMDQDGANAQFLTDGPFQVLTPRFSPVEQKITFMSYASGIPQVYLFDINDGRNELLGDFEGMTFAPRFAPDGQSVIMSLDDRGNSEIWTMDLNTRAKRQLTRHPAIDTSPSFSPDGRRITFTSDRSGQPQIYTMNADGSDQTRISFNQGSYSTPVWSPRGDLIAFTKQSKGEFMIGVMRTDGTGERILAKGFIVEGPTWSPNGRVLMYTATERGARGGSTVRAVDLTGANNRQVPTPGAASDPAWSPLLQ